MEKEGESFALAKVHFQRTFDKGIIDPSALIGQGNEVTKLSQGELVRDEIFVKQNRNEFVPNFNYPKVNFSQS